MEYSEKYTQVKNYYDQGLWSEAMVKNAVSKWITEEESLEILKK